MRIWRNLGVSVLACAGVTSFLSDAPQGREALVVVSDPSTMSSSELAAAYPNEFEYLADEFQLDDEGTADALRMTWFAANARDWAATYLDGYAGTWVDYSAGTVSIGVAGGAASNRSANDQVGAAFPASDHSPRVVKMKHSLRDLGSAAEAFQGAVDRTGDGTGVVTIDERAGELVIDGAPRADVERRAEVSRFTEAAGGPPVRWKENVAADPAEVHGGFNGRPELACTMAFTAVSPANGRAVLTAGHCGDSAVAYGSVTLSAAQFQRSFWPWLGGDADLGYDRQLHLVPSGNTTVPHLDAPNIDITGTILPAQGSVICRYGAASVAMGQAAAFCSTVTGYGYDGFVAMSVGCISGDSGGPSWVMGKAVGIAAVTTDLDWPVDASSTCFEAPVKDQLNGTGYFIQDIVTGVGENGAGTNFQPLGLFHSLAPTRILDTRSGAPVDGELAIPLGATLAYPDLGSVVLSVTAIPQGVGGYATVYAGDNGFVPASSNVTFTAAGADSNLVVSRVNRYTRQVKVFTSQSAHVIVDVIGYFSDTSGSVGAGGSVRAVPLPAARVYDSRPSGWMYSGNSRDIQITGLGGVPTTATAVIVNVTVTQPTGSGYLVAHQGATTAPSTSNLNFAAGETKARLAVVPLDFLGRIRLSAGGPSQELVIVDVQGYFTPTSTQTTGRTFGADGGGGRILDTRTGSPVGAGESVCVDVYSFRNHLGNGLPREGLVGVWLNVTTTSATTNGNLVVHAGGTLPTTSNINFMAGSVWANAVFVKLPSSTDGTVCFTSSNASVHVIADVLAWTIS